MSATQTLRTVIAGGQAAQLDEFFGPIASFRRNLYNDGV